MKDHNIRKVHLPEKDVSLIDDSSPLHTESQIVKKARPPKPHKSIKVTPFSSVNVFYEYMRQDRISECNEYRETQ